MTVGYLTPFLELDETISQLKWSPNTTHLYIGTKGFQHLTVTDGRLVFLPPFEFGITAAAWSPDSALIATGSACGHLVVAGGPEPWQLDVGAWVHDLSWNGELLAVAAGERLAVYDSDGTLTRDYPYRPGVITALSWSQHTGSSRIICGTVGGVECFDPLDQSRPFPVSTSSAPGAVTALRRSPDRRAVACGDAHGDCRVLFLDTDHECVLHGFPGRTDLIAWTAPGTHLCVVGGVEVTLWEVGLDDVSSHPVVLEGHNDDITALAVAPHTELIATGDTAGEVSVWQRDDDWTLIAQAQCDGPVSSLDWWAPGTTLTIGTEVGTVHSLTP